jgi:hypothetical protein
MRTSVLGLAVAFICAGTADVAAQRQIQIFASILDANGAPATSVSPDDLRVMENGVEGRITNIEVVEWGLKLQLLIDNGIGTGSENLIHLRNGVRGLLETLPEGIEVTMVTTAPQPRFLVRATTDRAELLRGVDRLAPDSSAGRFIESLNEATQRIERDKSDFVPIIVSLGSTAGDANVRERDIEQLMRRLQQRPTTVHVVMLSAPQRSSTGGVNQAEVGQAVTQMTRGRYENIAAGTRIATLLPEMGEMLAAAHQRLGSQFKLTFERPAGASGELGQLSMGARSNFTIASVSLDGRP